MLDQATIDSLRHNDVAPAGHLIDGVSDTGGAGEQIEVISPIDGTRLTTLADGDEAIVARAVAVARAAFEDGRIELLLRRELAALLRAAQRVHRF